MGVVWAAGARAAVPELGFAGLYGPVTAEGVQLSEGARGFVGRVVTIRGFMAPPLKAESDFFVLTRYPMSTCPFCSSGMDWPVDIVFVKLGGTAEAVEPSYGIAVTGRLETGMEMDASTGFVSLVRLVEARWRAV